MDQVKAAASKITAADKLSLMRKKMEENGVDGAFVHISFSVYMFECFYQLYHLLAFILYSE